MTLSELRKAVRRRVESRMMSSPAEPFRSLSCALRLRTRTQPDCKWTEYAPSRPVNSPVLLHTDPVSSPSTLPTARAFFLPRSTPRRPARDSPRGQKRLALVPS